MANKISVVVISRNEGGELKRTVENFDDTLPAAPLIPGCCFATRRDVIEATGGWDGSQLQRGNIDNEGCAFVAAWLRTDGHAGYRGCSQISEAVAVPRRLA